MYNCSTIRKRHQIRAQWYSRHAAWPHHKSINYPLFPRHTLTKPVPFFFFFGIRPHIRRIPANTTINFDKTSITPSKYMKNLGIYMNCYITFNVLYIDMKCTRKFSKFNFLRSLKLTREEMVQSLALSVINYCLPEYGTTNYLIMQGAETKGLCNKDMCWGS